MKRQSKVTENPAAGKHMDDEQTGYRGKPESYIAVNRQYKSTMFCMLFREKANLLELYNAVNHSTYENPEALEVVTLENAIYMNNLLLMPCENTCAQIHRILQRKGRPA